MFIIIIITSTTTINYHYYSAPFTHLFVFACAYYDQAVPHVAIYSEREGEIEIEREREKER